AALREAAVKAGPLVYVHQRGSKGRHVRNKRRSPRGRVRLPMRRALFRAYCDLRQQEASRTTKRTKDKPMNSMIELLSPDLIDLKIAERHDQAGTCGARAGATR